ncbi:condensation domain-containing protein [Kitasatospora sp. LaBMicrA B282]|uniref:condensation domain-containing protein n=1 Tax=Kitasatospora sp. LaBMicrA B282 TaxID=3420949 RepID=UPI003D0AC63E
MPSPHEETRALLLQIHREVLERPEVGPDDNFFDLGGNSLLAFRVIKLTAERLGARLSAQAVFTAATIGELAQRLTPVDRAPAAPVGVGAPRASMAQEWAVLSAVHDPDAPTLQFHAVYRVRGPLDTGALRAALQAVLDRHPALRTVLRVDGETVRSHLLDATAEPAVEELGWLPEPSRVTEALLLLDHEVRRPFDRTRAPLLRAHLVRLADRDQLLALVLDHVAADGWSLDLLVADLGAAYRAALTGEPAELTESRPYQRWAAEQWERHRTGRLDEVAGYWKGRLGADPSAFAVRLPGYRAGRGLSDPASLRLRVPAAAVSALEGACRELRSTPYCVSMAALKALIARQTGSPRVTVLTTAANRLEPEYQDTVGWYANGVFPTTDVELGLSFRRLVERVRGTALAATAHGDLPAWYVRRRMWPSVPAGFRKDPGVYFMFNELWGRALRFDGAEVEPVPLEETADSPGLHMWLLQDGPAVDLTVLHYRSEYPESYVREFADDFLAAVGALAAAPDLPVGEVLDSLGHRPPVIPSES